MPFMSTKFFIYFVASTIAAAIAFNVVWQQSTPAVIKAVPAIPGADPAHPQAKLLPPAPADMIDPKAKALYDGAIAAVMKLKTLDMTTQMKVQGDDAAMMPHGFGDPAHVLIQFEEDPTMLFTGMRIEVAKNGKVAQFVTFDGTKTLLVDNTTKTYQQAGKEWYQLLGSMGAAIPKWYLQERTHSAADESGLKLVSATLAGEETVDGLPCDVLRVVRTLDIDGDDGDADGSVPPAAQQMRLIETLAIARKDSLPRRITQQTEMAGVNDAGSSVTSSFSSAKFDAEITPATFAGVIPEGFTKAEDGNVESQAPPTLSVKVGDKALDFKLTDSSGVEVTLASLAGKVVLLDFWATWCGPCKQVMPILQSIADEYKDKNVAVIGVNMGERNPDDGVKYMAKKSFTYGCLLKGEDLAKAYRITGIPTLIIIGKDGTIAMIEVGAPQDAATTLRAAINTALAKESR